MSKNYPTLTYKELLELHPCEEELKAVTKKLGGPRKWNGKKINARQAMKAGVSFNNLVWAASAKARTDKDVERRLRMWMADCAARVLHIYEKDYPSDDRPRKAIEAARDYANGRITAAAWDAARDAARDAAWAAAWAAARAAAWDAARDAAWAAARAAAWDAAWAAARAAARDAAWAAAWAAAWDAEEQWQFDRLIQWLTDEPEPWPLPELPKEQRKAA